MRVSVTGREIPVYVDIFPEQVMYYIFDEAHYFVSDSLIRSETNFWYHQDFTHGISVFLTATPKPLLSFLTVIFPICSVCMTLHRNDPTTTAPSPTIPILTPATLIMMLTFWSRSD